MSKLSSNTIGKRKRADALAFFGHTTPKDIITLSTKRKRTTDSVLESLNNNEEKQLEKLKAKYPTRASEIAKANKSLSREQMKATLVKYIKNEASTSKLKLLYQYILEHFE